MARQVLSAVKDKPATKCGWVGFILSLVVICSGPILGISAAVIVPLVSDSVSEKVGPIVGFTIMIILAITLMVTLFCSTRAVIKGERSWAVLFALIISGLAVLYWIW